jgi:hypothetical protein
VCVAAAEFFLRQRQRATLDVFIKRKFMSVRPSVCRLFFSFFFLKGPRVFIGENGTARALLTFPFFLSREKKKESAIVKQITLG